MGLELEQDTEDGGGLPGTGRIAPTLEDPGQLGSLLGASAP